MRNLRMKNLKFAVLVFLVLSLGLFVPGLAGKASAELTIKANHDHISIDFFYHGSTVSVSGASDPGVDLIVKIASPEGHQGLKRKGKVGGVLWMNVGELKFENVPSLYFLRSTKKLADIISEEEMDRYVIGYPALEKHIEISPVADGKEKARWFEEFRKFKEHAKLYLSSTGNFDLKEKDGKQEYYTLLDWPYQASPGEYIVTVYAVKGKKVVDKVEANVLVEQAGLVKTLAGMAKNRGGLYGIISIIAALGAGFGVGMIFRKGGGAH